MGKEKNINVDETVTKDVADSKKEELLEIEKRIDSKLNELNTKLEQFSKMKEDFDSKVSEIKLPALTEKELIENSLKIKEQLDKMPKKKVRIPIDERNKQDKYVPVTISGYTYQIERGQSVEVPEEVERILIEAKYI